MRPFLTYALAMCAIGAIGFAEGGVLRAGSDDSDPAREVGRVEDNEDLILAERMAAEAPRTVASLGPTPETALVELDSTALATVGHGEQAIVHFLLHVVKIPGVSSALTSLARTAATSLSYTALDRATASLRYAQYTLWSGATAIVSSLFTVATCVISLNVPGLIVALPSLVAQITSFITSWMRLRRVRTGVAMQSEMCSSIAPLLAKQGSFLSLHEHLEHVVGMTRFIDGMMSRVEKNRITCHELVSEVYRRMGQDVAPPAGPTCDARVLDIRTRLGEIRRAVTLSLAKVENVLQHTSSAVSKWREHYMSTVGAWEANARGMSEENLPLPLKLAQMFNRLMEWITARLTGGASRAWARVSAAVGSLFKDKVSAAGTAPGGTEVGAAARLGDAEKVLRWSPSKSDYVLEDRKKRLVAGQGASLDSIEYDNTVDDIHQSMHLTLEMVRESAENPFHMALDRSRVQVYGVASITEHRTMRAAEVLPYTGPLILEPLWETDEAGAVSGESGWRLRIAPPSKPSPGEDRSVYEFRKKNLVFMTETYCLETAGLVMRDVLKSPDKAHVLKKEVSVQYNRPWAFTGWSCVSTCDPRRLVLFSVVPSFPVLALAERVREDLDKLEHGQQQATEEFCVSIHRSMSESNPMISGEMIRQEVEKASGGSILHGDDAVEFDDGYLAFETLGTHKLRLCTNNAAEAMVWFCAVANIGVRLPALGATRDKALLFVAGSPRVDPTRSLAENFRFGGLFADRSGTVVGGADVRAAVCTDAASIHAAPRPLLQSINEFDSIAPAPDSAAAAPTEAAPLPAAPPSTPVSARSTASVDSAGLARPLSQSTQRLVEEEQGIAARSPAACRRRTSPELLSATMKFMRLEFPEREIDIRSVGHEGIVDAEEGEEDTESIASLASDDSSSSSATLRLSECEGASVSEVLRRRMSDAVRSFVAADEVEATLAATPAPAGLEGGAAIAEAPDREGEADIEELGDADSGILEEDVDALDGVVSRMQAEADEVEDLIEEFDNGGDAAKDACLLARVKTLMDEHAEDDGLAEAAFHRCRRQAWVRAAEAPDSPPPASPGTTHDDIEEIDLETPAAKGALEPGTKSRV